MMGQSRVTTMLTHILLILGVILMLLPIYLAVVAASHQAHEMLKSPIPYWPGAELWHNFKSILFKGSQLTAGVPVYRMLWNSLIMALLIAFGKIVVSVLSAYAFVFFRFPLKKAAFALIFITLMLPVEVRIAPTYHVVVTFGLLNHFAGLTLPLIASATATFLFRQFYMTLPGELMDAARLDGAGAIRFLWDVVLPLSKTNIAALFIIMFIYGWNQYLWPLVVTTDANMNTIVMGIQHLATVADEVPQWNYIMSVALLAMLPPLLVIILMQRLFEKGLFEMEK